jgi:hypothetical protein
LAAALGFLEVRDRQQLLHGQRHRGLRRHLLHRPRHMVPPAHHRACLHACMPRHMAPLPPAPTAPACMPWQMAPPPPASNPC